MYDAQGVCRDSLYYSNEPLAHAGLERDAQGLRHYDRRHRNAHRGNIISYQLHSRQNH